MIIIYCLVNIWKLTSLNYHWITLLQNKWKEWHKHDHHHDLKTARSFVSLNGISSLNPWFLLNIWCNKLLSYFVCVPNKEQGVSCTIFSNHRVVYFCKRFSSRGSEKGTNRSPICEFRIETGRVVKSRDQACVSLLLQSKILREFAIFKIESELSTGTWI